MSFQDEEEGPCMHHRSLFDTIPAPPPAGLLDPPPDDGFRYKLGPAPMRKPSEPTLLSARGDFTGKGDNGEPVRVSANGRAAFPPECKWIPQVPADESSEFRFPGGVTEVRKPTRDELVTSVIDWSHLAKGYADEIYTEALRGNAYKEPIMALRSAVDRLDAALKELAES